MSTAMKIQPFPVVRAMTEAWPLFEEHRIELATNPDLMKLDPDVETYQLIEERGRLLPLGLYTDDGVLIGYSVNIIARNLHYDLIMCQNDVLYVQRDWRKGATGLRLMRATEDMAREAGCDIMLWHAKQDTNLQHILPRRGYRVQDIIFSKEL